MSVLEGWRRMGVVECHGELWKPSTGRTLAMSGDERRAQREALAMQAAREARVEYRIIKGLPIGPTTD